MAQPVARRTLQCEACPEKIELTTKSARAWHASCRSVMDYKRRLKRLPEYKEV